MTTTSRFAHRLRPMSGRDPQEEHRASTPLELLFDLTFVVSIGIAGEQTAHLLAEGHIGPAIGGFAFALFAIAWAWINFSWFASAYDTDDWLFRVLTMVQMIGVVVLALGLPVLFRSIDEGHVLDNGVVVAGYVIMRVALVLQWLRAAQQDPARRPMALKYAAYIAIAQLGWVLTAFLALELGATIAIALVLYAIELAGPVAAERVGVRTGVGTTPWHPHHIAERYGLFTIITLGEGVFGTIAAATAVIEEQGWSGETIVLVVCGIGLTFGLWWSYFTLPAGAILERYRGRAFVWGYGHLLIFAAIAATGSGIHMVAYLIEEHSAIGIVGTVLSVVIPVTVFVVTLFALYTWLVRSFDPFHIALFAGTVVLVFSAVVAVALGAPLSVALILITLAPFVVVVGYELVGHRHEAVVLDRLLG